MEFKMQFGIMKNCFVDCVQGYREDALNANEKKCMQNCATRETKLFMAMAA